MKGGDANFNFAKPTCWGIRRGGGEWPVLPLLACAELSDGEESPATIVEVKESPGGFT